MPTIHAHIKTVDSLASVIATPFDLSTSQNVVTAPRALKGDFNALAQIIWDLRESSKCKTLYNKEQFVSLLDKTSLTNDEINAADEILIDLGGLSDLNATINIEAPYFGEGSVLSNWHTDGMSNMFNSTSQNYLIAMERYLISYNCLITQYLANDNAKLTQYSNYVNTYEEIDPGQRIFEPGFGDVVKHIKHPYDLGHDKPAIHRRQSPENVDFTDNLPPRIQTLAEPRIENLMI